MQIVFSILKSITVLLLLAVLGGFLPSFFMYVAFSILTITLFFFGKKWRIMARHRVDCYFGLVSSVLAVFLITFTFVNGDSVNMAQFGILLWILISLTRLIENNRIEK